MTIQALSVQEKNVAGFGLLTLFQSRDCLNQYSIVLKLDIFQSNCQRDWLALRWKEPCLQQSLLRLKGDKDLHIIFPFEESSRQKAIDFVEGWVQGIVDAYDRFKKSRN